MHNRCEAPYWLAADRPALVSFATPTGPSTIDGSIGTPIRSLLDEKRTEYVPHVFPGNLWFCAGSAHTRRVSSEPQAAFTRHIGSYHWIERATIWFPLYLRDEQFGELVDGVKRVANLSETAQRYIESLGAEPEDLFHHVLATLHDPAYREANAGGLRMGWPRIPLPDSAAELAASAELAAACSPACSTPSPTPPICSTPRSPCPPSRTARRCPTPTSTSLPTGATAAREAP